MFSIYPLRLHKLRDSILKIRSIIFFFLGTGEFEDKLVFHTSVSSLRILNSIAFIRKSNI